MAWNQLATLADTTYTDEQVAERGYQAAGVGPVRNVKTPRLYVDATQPHWAFPSLVQRDDGVLVAVVRGGTNHAATKDGKVYLVTSADLGRTWSAATLIASGAAGVDLRDPCISKSRNGTTLYLTYFKGTVALAAAGAFFRKSTDGGSSWTAEQRMEALPYAACCAPVVELATGRLLVPIYARSGAETLDSVFICYSDNGGTSWSQSRILNGTTLATHMQEPWIVQKPGAANLLMTYRYGGTSNIGASWTANATGTGIASWSVATVAFQGTGRPSTVWLSTGSVEVHYRNLGNTKYLTRACDSPETAATWTPPYAARNGQMAGLWTYGQAIELGGGVTVGLWCEENAAGTSSKMYATWFARGGGATPGGVIPDNWAAISTLYDRVEFALDMQGERRGTNPAVPYDVNALAGTLTSVELGNPFDIRAMASSAADGVPDRAFVDVGTEDVAIEADFYGTVQSGFAILFRVVDASNFLMFTVETDFTAHRLYKVVAGVATSLGLFTSITPASSWHTLRVEARGTLIQCYRDGWPLLAYGLAAGAEQSTFLTPTKHGFSLNAPVGGVHYMRRFVIWSYGT